MHMCSMPYLEPSFLFNRFLFGGPSLMIRFVGVVRVSKKKRKHPKAFSVNLFACSVDCLTYSTFRVLSK